MKTQLPQGSLLGPCLFNLFINDINFFIDEVSLRLYADDTTEYLADVSPMVLEFKISRELHILSEWFTLNYININSSKTQALPIERSKYSYNFQLNDQSIEIKDNLKVLGISIDPSLTYAYKVHIKNQLRKAFSKTAALHRIKRFLPQDVMIRLYTSFILPILQSGFSEYSIGKTECNKLEDANYYMLRTILQDVTKSRPYESLLQQAKIKSLANRRYFQSLDLHFKCMKEHGP